MTIDPLGPLIARYESCWSECRFRELRGLWPDDETAPFWLPEEAERPLVDWASVDAYLTECEALIPRMAVSTRDFRVKPVVPGVVAAVWMLRWQALTWYGNPPRTRALAGDVKVSATCREVAPGDWRFVAYHEAALGPLPFVRRVYERAVEPGFRAGNSVD